MGPGAPTARRSGGSPAPSRVPQGGLVTSARTPAGHPTRGAGCTPRPRTARPQPGRHGRTFGVATGDTSQPERGTPVGQVDELDAVDVEQRCGSRRRPGTARPRQTADTSRTARLHARVAAPSSGSGVVRVGRTPPRRRSGSHRAVDDLGGADHRQHHRARSGQRGRVVRRPAVDQEPGGGQHEAGGPQPAAGRDQAGGDQRLAGGMRAGGSRSPCCRAGEDEQSPQQEGRARHQQAAAPIVPGPPPGCVRPPARRRTAATAMSTSPRSHTPSAAGRGCRSRTAGCAATRWRTGPTPRRRTPRAGAVAEGRQVVPDALTVAPVPGPATTADPTAATSTLRVRRTPLGTHGHRHHGGERQPGSSRA